MCRRTPATRTGTVAVSSNALREYLTATLVTHGDHVASAHASGSLACCRRHQITSPPTVRRHSSRGGNNMLGDRWIYDRVPTERFPDYTRGNAGEVLADPVSPLAWTFCWEPGPVQGCVDGFEQMGVFDRLEYGDPPATFGL